MEKRITQESPELFEKRLRQEEKAALTVSEYLRDVRRFLEYVGEGGEADKEQMLQCAGTTLSGDRYHRKGTASVPAHGGTRDSGFDKGRTLKE